MANNVFFSNKFLFEKQSFKYKIDLNDIYYDEIQQNTLVHFDLSKFLGVYDNKMYIKQNA